MEFTNNSKYKGNVLLESTFKFSVGIIKFCESLNRKQKFAISNQLIRSGTSIGANSKESQNAQSDKDFIHKLKIALKEADETEYWLFLCLEIEDYPNPVNLINELTNIIKLLNKIISTKMRNMKA
mgnify:CR=1 FL=1